MLNLALTVGNTETPEAVQFWILAPIAVLSALGMLVVKKAVHSALLLAWVMITLAIFYIAQDALFLGIVQIVVYTGAVMMLFLFILMLVGVDSSDSLVETIKGQRAAAITASVGLGGLLVSLIGRATIGNAAVGLRTANYGGTEYNIVSSTSSIASHNYLIVYDFNSGFTSNDLTGYTVTGPAGYSGTVTGPSQDQGAGQWYIPISPNIFQAMGTYTFVSGSDVWKRVAYSGSTW